MRKFIELFSKLGFSLNAGKETWNLLHVDQRSFQSKLVEYAKENSSNIECLKEFLNEYLESNEMNLLVALLPTRNSGEQQQAAHSSNQDNLIRILVELEPLQSFIFDLLVEKTFSYGESNESGSDRVALGITINVAIYCINQFKFIPFIYAPQNLRDKLLELITSLSNVHLKREIIKCFPDIMSDSEYHGQLTEQFAQFLGDADLVSVTLETILDLCVSETILERVVDRLFCNYGLLNEKDIASVVNFILKTASDLKSISMFEKLREKLRFDQIKDETNRLKIIEVIQVYFSISIKSVDLFNALIERILVELKENTLSQTRPMKPLDFIIFCIIYSQHYKEADRLLKQLLKDENNIRGVDESLQAIFKLGPSVLKELTPLILLVGTSLISSPNEGVYTTAMRLYKLGLSHLEKKELRRGLVDNLVAHITSSNQTAREHALDVLVDVKPALLLPFSVQLKSMLDFIEFFSLAHIRKVFSIVWNVAYESSIETYRKRKSGEQTVGVSSIGDQLLNESVESYNSSGGDSSSSTIQDMLYMLINKQLSSSTLKSKQIGLIGALMLIKSMARRGSGKQHNQDNSTISSGSQAEEYFSCTSSQTSLIRANSTNVAETSAYQLSIITNEMKQIWQMILDSSKSSPELLGLFEDDLSNIIASQPNNTDDNEGSGEETNTNTSDHDSNQRLGENIQLLIKESLQQMYTNLFKLTPTRFVDARTSQLTVDYSFGLDTSTVGALNLLPHVLYDTRKRNRALIEATTMTSSSIDLASNRLSPLPAIAIPSTFRLMAALESKNIMVLKDYLGLPILTIKKDELFKFANRLDTSALSDLATIGPNLSNKFKHTLNDDERRIICNSVFITINWFIELINAFSPLIVAEGSSTELVVEMVPKLVSRLNSVYDLKQVLVGLLPHTKCYRAPLAVFGIIDSSVEEVPYASSLIKVKEASGVISKKKSSSSSKRKPTATKMGRKKKQIKTESNDGDEAENEDDEMIESGQEDEEMDEEDETMMDEDEDKETDENKENNPSDSIQSVLIDLDKLWMHFREFDLSVVNFLTLDIELVEMVPDTAANQTAPLIRLKPHLFYAVISDFNQKIALILKTTTTSSSALRAPGFGVGVTSSKPSKTKLFLARNSTRPYDLAKHLIENCLESILLNLNAINKHIRSIQDRNDGIRDPGELFHSARNLSLLKSFNQILKLVQLLLTWLTSPAHVEQHKSLLSELVRKLASLGKNESREDIASSMSSTCDEFFAFNYLARLKEVVLDLSTAELLAMILDLLTNKLVKTNERFKSFEKKCKLILINVCDYFVNGDFNPKANALIAGKQTTNQSISNLLNLLIRNDENGLERIETILAQISSDDFLENPKESEVSNLVKCHFGSFFKFLLEYTVESVKRVADLDVIERLAAAHSTLILLKRASRNQLKEINVLTLLKNSRLFLTRFQRINKEVLNTRFEQNATRILQLLDRIHDSVNYLKEVCASRPNASVARQSPVYMRCVEAFVLSVKELLYVNNCDQAFKMKSLIEVVAKTAKPSGGKRRKKGTAAAEEDEQEDDEGQEEDQDEQEDGDVEEDDDGEDDDDEGRSSGSNNGGSLEEDQESNQNDDENEEDEDE